MIYKILMVDDEPANLRLLERLFSRDFQCLTASSGAEAIRLLEQHDVAILISDQRMPMMTGIELLRHTAAMRPHMVRILLTGYTDVEALVEAINSGLVYMYITKPWNNEDLRLRINRACQHYEQNKNRQALADANQRLILRLQAVKLHIVSALSEMLKIRDKSAYEHALRVRNYAMMIAAKMNLTEEQKEELSIAALLHDLVQSESHRNTATGKPASEVEQANVQAHFLCEASLFHSTPELAEVADILSCDRENYDGTGLPRGLRGEEIPFCCRILRLADEYDQMMLPESSAPMTHDEAMSFLTQRSGKQFDPRLIEVLLHLSPEELEKPLHSTPTYSEFHRPVPDNFEAAI